jgi:predicted ATP-grasp superfamily ATP-dependent carboligase
MRVFVFEYLTAHGIGRDPTDPLHAMYREGRAMRDAVVADFGQVAGVEVLTPPGDGLPYSDDRFRADLSRSDRQLVIAPESNGVLLGLANRCDAGGHSLGCTPAAIQLTADKLALADHWRGHGIPTPATTDREPTACEAFPVVWKPRDGCGSTATYLLHTGLDVSRARAAVAAGEYAGPMILQEFVPGRAASVAFLCGPAGNVPLLPTLQHLSDDGRFHYRGGELPIASDLADRAVRLASRAAGCVQGLKGYVGADLVLGPAADGARDYVIEINPRLTTSYVGLRALADFNLARATLEVADGQPVGKLRWKCGRVHFTPEGVVA